MTLRELFSEWGNTQELFKGALISGVFCVVFVIWYIFDAETNHRESLLYGALTLAILHVACRFRLSIINKKK